MTLARNIYIDSTSFKQTILNIVENEAIKYTDHATQRMIERKISQLDIRNLLSGDYEYIGTQSDNGMMYMVRPSENELLPHVVFGIDSYDDLKFLNIVTVYLDSKKLETLDADDELAMRLEHSFALSHKRNDGIKEVRVVLSSEQRDQLYLLIQKEIYAPNIDTYGIGMISEITATKEYIMWTLKSAEGEKVYKIEGRTYENLLARIKYSKFTKKNDVVEVVPDEELPVYDNRILDNLPEIQMYDVWSSQDNIKNITTNHIYGKINSLTIDTNIKIEQAILKYEGMLGESYDYFESPIVTFMMFDDATVYTIRKGRSQLGYVIRGLSHQNLLDSIDNYEEAYGEKLRVPRSLDAPLKKKMDAYVHTQLPVLNVIGYSTNTKDAIVIAILKNHNVKHILIPHNTYHKWLQELGVEMEGTSEIVQEEVVEVKEKKRVAKPRTKTTKPATRKPSTKRSTNTKKSEA